MQVQGAYTILSGGIAAGAGTIIKLPPIPMGDAGALLKCLRTKVASALQRVSEAESSVGADIEWQLLRSNLTQAREFVSTLQNASNIVAAAASARALEKVDAAVSALDSFF